MFRRFEPKISARMHCYLTILILRSFSGDFLDDSWQDPDYTPLDSDTDESVVPPSVVSTHTVEMPRYPGLIPPPTISVTEEASRETSFADDAFDAVLESAGPLGQLAAGGSARPTAVVSYAVATTANSLGRRKWDRRNVCFFLRTSPCQNI